MNLNPEISILQKNIIYKIQIVLCMYQNGGLENHKRQHCAKGPNDIILDDWHNDVIVKVGRVN